MQSKHSTADMAHITCTIMYVNVTEVRLDYIDMLRYYIGTQNHVYFVASKHYTNINHVNLMFYLYMKWSQKGCFLEMDIVPSIMYT